MAWNLDTLSPKEQRDPTAANLYRAHADYLTAYRLHTDLRVRRDGPAAAIGGDWEPGGQRQLAFLQAHGLTPEKTLLDFGCGTGRLARVAVPYLDAGHYYGLDLSFVAIKAAHQLAMCEGWEEKSPHFMVTAGTCAGLPIRHVDIIWCYAVMIHLPPEVVEAFIASLQPLDFGVCYFTFKPTSVAPRRTGLKQFSAPLSWYQATAERYGFRVTACDGMPWIPQPLAQLTREKSVE